MSYSSERIKGIIKCFLIINKGRWFSSSEISDFINSHYFALGKYGVSSHKIGSMFKDRRNNTLFGDISAKKENDNTWRYCYEG